jgi:hypothetical protein
LELLEDGEWEVEDRPFPSGGIIVRVDKDKDKDGRDASQDRLFAGF